MKTARTLRVAILVLLVGMMGAQPAGAQTTTDLFDPNGLQEIRLFINSRDYKLLQQNYLLNTYYTADLLWRGLRVRNVAVRSRGVGSRSGTKIGLRVDFNRYSSKQKFLGLNSLILDNMLQDASFIGEPLALSFFARMGMPTPRTSYARVFINNTFQGLYSVVESVDTPFLQRTLNESGGYLFGYQYWTAWHGEDLGDDYQPYKQFFEPETRQLESDNALYGPIREMIREVNAPVDAVWRERVEQYIDLPMLVRHVAIETFLSEFDGFLGVDGMNNFFLYRPQGSNVHRLIPWDKDASFNDSRSSVLARVDENVLFRNVLTFPDLFALYLDTLAECAAVATDGEWMLAEAERLSALAIGPADSDPLKPHSNEGVREAMDRVRQFVRERPAFVLEEVARLRRQ
jgi:spore coat protein CotH